MPPEFPISNKSPVFDGLAYLAEGNEQKSPHPLYSVIGVCSLLAA